ncbi:MAG: hypothetical protein JWP68_1840 [Modestobacter sp.]|nr:hypothetical protein [Modestobacter sp.]
MTRGRAGLVATAMVAAGLLAGCSGGDDETPTPSTTPSSARTPPAITPSGTAPLPSGTTLPETLPPASGTGVPVPIPSQPQN